MADISNNFFILNHSLDSYENVLETYNWIKCALEYVFRNEKNICINIKARFKCFENSYTCESIDEFKKLAFGKEITMGNLHVLATMNSEPFVLASVFVPKSHYNEKQEISISSHDELIVANIKEALVDEKYKQNNECKTIDNSIHIGENVIINNSNIANAESYITQEKSITPTEKWYKKIVWEVVVPIIVGIVIAVVVAILKIE